MISWTKIPLVAISWRYCVTFEVMLFIGRMLRSGKLPVLNLLTGQKSGFFALQGRLVWPI